MVEQSAITEMAPTKVGDGGILPEGALKSDIEIHRHTKDGKTYFTVGPGKYTARVANWVEFGHRQVRGGYLKKLNNGKTRGPGKQVGDVQEHPFIRPAYESSKQEVTDAIATVLVEEIEKSAAKGGK